jgi:NTE family protein
VLSGGGAQGAVQVGMMGTLLDHGHVPDAIVATSVGALNAAFVAADPTLARVSDLADKWGDTHAGAVFGSRRDVAANLLRRRPSLFGNERLRRLVSDWLPVERLEDLAVPVRVATTRLADGRAVHHDCGPVSDLLCAAAAVPGLLPPVALPDAVTGEPDLHVDGGIAENLPLSGVPGLVDRLGWAGDPLRVFTLDATHAVRPPTLRTPVTALVAALAATLAGQDEHPLAPTIEVTRIRAGGTVAITDFSRTRELVRLGASTALRALHEPTAGVLAVG